MPRFDSPFQLTEIAVSANISVPTNTGNYMQPAYPHFWALCVTQLGREMTEEKLAENARKIAAVSGDALMMTTYSDFVNMGVYEAP